MSTATAESPSLEELLESWQQAILRDLEPDAMIFTVWSTGNVFGYLNKVEHITEDPERALYLWAKTLASKHQFGALHKVTIVSVGQLYGRRSDPARPHRCASEHDLEHDTQITLVYEIQRTNKQGVTGLAEITAPVYATNKPLVDAFVRGYPAIR